MSNYTPGKWKVNGTGWLFSDLPPRPGEHNERRIRVFFDETSSERRTNARLIEAAPEMMELLDDVAMELSIVSPILHPANGHVEALIERIDTLLRRIESEGGEDVAQ